MSANMPRTCDCQVNENPFKIRVNSRNFSHFHPLGWEKTDNNSQRQQSSAAGYFHQDLPDLGGGGDKAGWAAMSKGTIPQKS